MTQQSHTDVHTRELKICIYTKIYIWIFIAALFIFKYILLIMLLKLSQYFLPLIPLLPAPPPTLQHPPPQLSSCPWVAHISSLASPFPILFLISPCVFCAYLSCFLKKYILLSMLLQLSYFFSPLFPLALYPWSHHHSPTLVHVHGSCI